MTRLAFPLFTALAAAYGIALLTKPLLRDRSRWNAAVTAASAATLLACPLLIPPEHVVLRAIAALVCLDIVLRVTDYARQLRAGTTLVRDWPGYTRLLIPFPFLLADAKRQRLSPSVERPRGVELIRLACGMGIAAIVLIATLYSSRIPALRASFLLDHTVKAGLFVVGVEAASQGLLALERLAGFDPPPFVDRTFLSRSPAEFWFRWNQRVRMWLYFNVFVPAGGRRRPVQGILAVYVASALLHELEFGIATSRFTGCQATFFLLQAPAVLLSPRLERLAKSAGAVGELVARGVTGLWLLATSMFFFEGIDRVFPFLYASQPWLP